MDPQPTSSQSLSSSGRTFFLTVSSAKQSCSYSQWSGCTSPQMQSLVLNGPSWQPPKDFGFCKGKSISTNRALHVGGRLAYSGISPWIPRVPITTLLPRCHAGLGEVAYTSPSVNQANLLLPVTATRRHGCALLCPRGRAIDGSIILQWITGGWIRFVWLRIWPSGWKQ
jgi:hypothetical protein